MVAATADYSVIATFSRKEIPVSVGTVEAPVTEESNTKDTATNSNTSTTDTTTNSNNNTTSGATTNNNTNTKAKENS